ncbi:amino acid ABC transporter permease [Micrococcus lylae]|uniref:Amino acid ABC transporter permease n=1 Tax=Micrococcus lylae TaxID=1273 RepID=A0ABY2K128_9MICC|nr:amino acid ABC transporter permease [Micrococcus lylae]TFI00386.1 amino acid ABC transporter permease [Micrococcus lylae]
MSARSVLFDAPGPKARRNVLIVNVVALIGVAIVAWIVLGMLNERGQLEPSRWISAVNGNAWSNYYLPGLQFTLQSAAIAVVTSVLFGLVFGFLRLAPYAPIRAVSGVVVEFFRAVPVLLMMVFFYQVFAMLGRAGVIPSADGPYFAVIVGLTLYNGAVIAELVRSGVKSLPKGQREAAAAIGMTPNQSLRLVEVPQALVAMLPSLLSQFVVILKDSALGYLIGFYELLQYARQLGSGQGNILQTLVVAAVVFIVINVLLTWLATLLSTKLSSKTAGRTKPRAGSSAVKV